MTPAPIFLAPAKINWHLAVGGKRPDGYHEIESLFETIDLCDRLHVDVGNTPAGLSLVTPEGIPSDGRNTIAKADAALREILPGLPAVSVRLEKAIPHEAGLGGGSSDAACYLLAINARLQLKLSNDELVRIALSVGSDVPFFLCGGMALASGRGEYVEPFFDDPEIKLLLVMPDARSPTADAYHALNRSLLTELPTRKEYGSAFSILCSCEDRRLAHFREHCRNDFEAVMPDAITAPLRAIRERGGLGFLSGSGAASFGWFWDETELRSACAELTPMFPFVRIVRTLSRNDYLKQFV